VSPSFASSHHTTGLKHASDFPSITKPQDGGLLPLATHLYLFALLHLLLASS